VTTHKTFCRFCHAMCGIEVDVENGVPVKIRGDRDNPMTQGFTCIKGRSLPDQHTHESRLLSHLTRDPGGAFVPIDIEDAQDEVSASLASIIEKHGTRAVAMYVGTAAYQSSFTMPFARAWVGGLGSASYYSSLTIDQPNKILAPQLHGSFQGGLQSFDSSDVWMVFGCNPVVSMYGGTSGFPSFNPTQRVRDATKRGLDLIVVDPRTTELAKMADLHLPIRPGEDAALLGGMIRVLIEEELYDADFVARFTEGLDGLTASLEGFTREWVERRTGLPWSLVEEAARRFARGPRGLASSGTGPSMAPRPNLSEHLILCMNTLCGRYNREGERVANPGCLTPPRAFKEEASSPFAGFRMEPKSRIRGLGQVAGELPTAALSDEILTPGEGQVRALIVMGGNPLLSFPDQAKTQRALEALELLVVLDPIMSGTAKLAHYVIAPTLSLERPDTTFFMDTWYPQPYAMYTPAIVEPPGEVIAEWDFLWGLAHRMGMSIRLMGQPVDMENKPTADDLIAMMSAFGRVPLDEVKRHTVGGIFDDDPFIVEPGDPNATGRMQLHPAEIAAEIGDLLAEAPVEGAGYRPGDQFTHRLISRRLREVFNSMGHQLPALRAKRKTNPAYMNPADLAALGIEDDSLVEIDSGHGRIRAVAQGAEDVPRGVISMAHSWGEGMDGKRNVRDVGSPTSRLVDNEDFYDTISGIPLQSAIPVNVSPAG